MKSLIVVAEDDLLISMLIEDVLTEHGYVVVSVTTADAAIIELGRLDEVAALVTDIDMPGEMNGLDLAAALATDRPDLPVIVASGKHRPDFSQLSGAHFLAKPFLADELIATVDKLVTSRAANGRKPT